ncbi:BnaAnng33330D [Brassica napus]|uniref:BnaAnng33330D protein n=1 Tax=Brassica napus TaxID=3708 RepID=A0A078JV65_BRANA|nr:BnaAnng33330D [Brassica napus]
MDTPPNCDRGHWSELPMDLLRCLLERLSFVDFHCAKMVCSNWYLCSKQTLGSKAGSPMLIMSEKEGSYRLYNPEEDRVYEAKSNYRFLGSSGKWFLVVDSRSDLHIINVFSNERIRLPPLETVKSSLYKIERLGGDKGAVLWVDEKKGDYFVVWRFEECPYLRFCKKGDVHYHEISTRFDVQSGGLKDVVLKGNSLYVQTEHGYIRHLDLSGQHSFEDVWVINWHPVRMGGYRIISFSNNFAVTTSGEVLSVLAITSESSFERNRTFHLYKKQDTKLIKVDSLGDEALFLDFGITVPADHTLGIEPNSIYFTRDDRFRHKRVSCIDICVYNLATKTIKRFPSLYNLKLKDAQWFLPS